MFSIELFVCEILVIDMHGYLLPKQYIAKLLNPLVRGKRIVETFHNPFLNSLRKKHTRKNGLLNISTIRFCEMPLFLDIAQKTDCGKFPQSVS